MTRPNLDAWAMEMAFLTSRRTTCLRRAVGAVLLSERGHVLATGYNGVAAGQPHCNERSVKGFASVPERPGPEHWQDDKKFYFDRAVSLHPGLVPAMGGIVRPCGVSRLAVKGHVSVEVEHFPNACSGATAESGKNLDGCQAIHAEQNALLQCRDVYSIETAYVTTSPCMTCCKLLLNTSCKRIVFGELYTDGKPGELWTGAGRAWEHYKG